MFWKSLLNSSQQSLKLGYIQSAYKNGILVLLNSVIICLSLRIHHFGVSWLSNVTRKGFGFSSLLFKKVIPTFAHLKIQHLKELFILLLCYIAWKCRFVSIELLFVCLCVVLFFSFENLFFFSFHLFLTVLLTFSFSHSLDNIRSFNFLEFKSFK